MYQERLGALRDRFRRSLSHLAWSGQDEQARKGRAKLVTDDGLKPKVSFIYSDPNYRVAGTTEGSLNPGLGTAEGQATRYYQCLF